LNDSTELIKPCRIASEDLEKKVYECQAKNAPEIEFQSVRQMLEDIESWENINICVASFCSGGDLLSQWRGYGSYGSGFAIGFDTRTLLEPRSLFEFKPCLYLNPDDYEGAIHSFISDTINRAISDKEPPIDFIGRFINFAATLKLDCFKEEDEWRILSHTPLSFEDPQFSFRINKQMLIPYYSLKFGVESIKTLVIGPCKHPELTEQSIWGLKSKYALEGLKPGKILISNIPYRQF
jgi:hypothetical protein